MNRRANLRVNDHRSVPRHHTAALHDCASGASCHAKHPGVAGNLSFCVAALAVVCSRRSIQLEAPQLRPLRPNARATRLEQGGEP